jgi:hypothetical protein
MDAVVKTEGLDNSNKEPGAVATGSCSAAIGVNCCTSRSTTRSLPLPVLCLFTTSYADLKHLTRYAGIFAHYQWSFRVTLQQDDEYVPMRFAVMLR